MVIINDKDPRSLYLDSIFQKYKFDNIVFNYGNGYIDYFIPPELVLRSKSRVDTYVVTLQEFDSNDCRGLNLVAPRNHSYFLKECCNLTNQELFDLCILHINDTDDRPKCPYCNEPIIFSGEMQRGYSRHHWTNEPSRHLFCSGSCRSAYMHSHLDEYPHMRLTESRAAESLITPKIQFKSALKRFVNNSPEESNFYVCFTENGFKYGITKDIEGRLHNLSKDGWVKGLKVFIGSTVRIALLEYLIKVDLIRVYPDQVSEYISDDSRLIEFKKSVRRSLEYIFNKSDDNLWNIIDSL